jgi:cell wall-associated NlpC family hydrolase
MTLPKPESTARASLGARLSSLLAALAVVISTLVAGTLTAAPARANNPAGPHDPIGVLESVVANGGGSYTLSGWAADPDALTSNATVLVLVDGQKRGSVVTNVARPRIVNKRHTGPTPGFTTTVTPGSGVHSVCVAVANALQGLPTVLRCVTTPLGSAVPGNHDPQGQVTYSGASANTMTVSGNVSDPDFYASRLVVVLYVDGSSAKTVATRWGKLADGTNVNHFSITVPVSAGSHLGCIWVVNIGFGSNSSLGCNAADTRGPAGTGPFTTPAINNQVVKIAKRQIGKPYVWAAAGPNAFDCSGLVLWSYARAGMPGIYHQSGVQFTKARLIPASRARPGDLVFYHDSVGSVYHVGIYLAPNSTVAAIDTAEGVNYQSINWGSATYGSFTHS